MTDDIRELIQRSQGGDEAALATLIERYRERIKGLVRHRLGDGLRHHLDSSDIVQSVCFDAMRGIEALEQQDEEGLVHWLARVTENTIRDRYRYFDAGKRKSPVAPPDADLPTVSRCEGEVPTPSRVVGRLEQMDALLSALERIPEDYRRIIVLTRIEGKSHDEAAAIMGRTSKAARMLLARARARLLEALDSDGATDD
ncbi:MAG: sigma-70 family RNA polymerase sigma factor [Planctomycetes bacterium]|nr:sigma-70 family RNA polymerase sigma factor [Planctomycetota bacterium]